MSINADPNDVISIDVGGRGDDSYKYSSSHTNSTGNMSRSPGVAVAMGDGEQSERAAFASGKMSSVRRTFCLFCTFDLGLSFILWVIYTQLIGDTGWKAFERQVEEYDFKTSLFDTVLMSAVRFVCLILAYALFRIRHWWTVAVTTTISSAFLLTKVFLFDFGNSENSKNPLSYCLLIISFVLAWVETWFLDFKVLPWERKELQRLSETGSPTNYGAVSVSDRRRLLAPDDAMSTITFDQYYSPVGTPEGSDNEEEGEGAAPSLESLPPNQAEEYRKCREHAWNALWDYLHLPEDQWKLESGKSHQTGLIYSHQTKKYGKVFKLEGEVELDPKSLFEEMVLNIEQTPTWNPTLEACHTVLRIDSNTDISHNIAAGIGGIVSSRDFVSLRHWGMKDGMYLSAGEGITHPNCPPDKKRIRGDNGPGGWAFKPVPGEPNKCIFVWVMNTDIKGWIPQRVMDQTASIVLTDYLKYLRQRVTQLRGQA